MGTKVIQIENKNNPDWFLLPNVTLRREQSFCTIMATDLKKAWQLILGWPNENNDLFLPSLPGGHAQASFPGTNPGTSGHKTRAHTCPSNYLGTSPPSSVITSQQLPATFIFFITIS